MSANVSGGAGVSEDAVRGGGVTNTQLALEFFESWAREDTWVDGFERFFTDTTEWENHGLSTIVGKQAAIEGQYHFQKLLGFSTVEVDIICIAEDAHGSVLCERVDRYPGSTKLQSLVVMGTMEFEGGRITKWRDYFDSAAVHKLVDEATANATA